MEIEEYEQIKSIFRPLRRDCLTLAYADSRSKFKKKRNQNDMEIDNEGLQIFNDISIAAWNGSFVNGLLDYVTIV